MDCDECANNISNYCQRRRDGCAALYEYGRIGDGYTIDVVWWHGGRCSCVGPSTSEWGLLQLSSRRKDNAARQLIFCYEVCCAG